MRRINSTAGHNPCGGNTWDEQKTPAGLEENDVDVILMYARCNSIWKHWCNVKNGGR